MNPGISMLRAMIKLQNSGLTLSGCKVVEDLAVLEISKIHKVIIKNHSRLLEAWNEYFGS
ncbi:hypothetical protein BMS3Bbin05_02282 [bacterium BMS3Bbin05]|nr:hypothetical protein BMS3Bbin05_02282 [bacterium BMS3Bbin05]